MDNVVGFDELQKRRYAITGNRTDDPDYQAALAVARQRCDDDPEFRSKLCRRNEAAAEATASHVAEAEAAMSAAIEDSITFLRAALALDLIEEMGLQNELNARLTAAVELEAAMEAAKE